MTTKYVKNLTYDESKALIKYVNDNLSESLAFFVKHGIAIDHDKPDWLVIEKYLKTLQSDYVVQTNEAYVKSFDFLGN